MSACRAINNKKGTNSSEGRKGKGVAIKEVKHKKRLDQQHELIEQQLQFQKALQANQEMQQTQVKETSEAFDYQV